MKKILVVIAAALIAVSANAQWYVGGGLGFNTGENSSSLNFCPEAGYVFNEHWSAGLSISLLPTWYSSNDFTNININPYVRYTFLRMGSLSVFADAMLDYHISIADYHGRETGLEGVTKESSSMIGMSLCGGAAYQINEHFSIVSHLINVNWHQDGGIGFGITTPNSIGVYYSF